MKYLYLIWINTQGYDTFDSAVVVAESEKEAKKIHPNGRDEEPNSLISGFGDWSWALIENIQVKKIGVADESQYNERVICASFNAG
jgi:hypothetical protein